MVPLNFIHFNHLSIKDLDRIFIIRKVGFHEDFLLFNNIRRNSDAFLELRYMKHIVDCCELRGKLQSISHGSTLVVVLQTTAGWRNAPA